jgi:hypothetical protein
LLSDENAHILYLLLSIVTVTVSLRTVEIIEALSKLWLEQRLIEGFFSNYAYIFLVSLT